MAKPTFQAIDELITLSWEDKAPCSCKVIAHIPAEAIKIAFDNTAAYIAGSAKVSGFRQGQVPMSLIRSKYKESIQGEATETLLATAAMKMRADKDHRVLSYGIPESEKIEITAGKDSDVTFEADLAPVIELPAYEGLEVKVDIDSVTDEAVAARLTQLREAFGEFTKVADELKKDDIVQAKYSADVILPEDAPAGLKALVNAESTWLWIGENDRIPGASAAMTGKKVGDTVTFDATFPSDHAEPFLAGKTLSYAIVINDAQRRVPLTDNKVLCERFGVADMDAVNARLKKDMEEEAKEANQAKIAGVLREKLSDAVPLFPLPPTTLQRKIFVHLREIMNEVVKSEADGQAFTANRETHEAEAKSRAEKSLHTFFILSAIADKEEITVSEKELEDRIAMIARYLKQSVEATKKVIQERQAEQDIVNDILEQKVLDLIIKSAKVN